jgi:hypothetical protein
MIGFARQAVFAVARLAVGLVSYGAWKNPEVGPRNAAPRANSPGLEFFPVGATGHRPHIEQATVVHAKLQEFFRAHPGQ